MALLFLLYQRVLIFIDFKLAIQFTQGPLLQNQVDRRFDVAQRVLTGEGFPRTLCGFPLQIFHLAASFLIAYMRVFAGQLDPVLGKFGQFIRQYQAGLVSSTSSARRMIAAMACSNTAG